MTKVSAPILQMRVKIDGRFAQEYRHAEQTFVEGVQGKGFSLTLYNCTPGRLLVHPSVDGLSVMNGQPARKNDFNDGYIMRAHSEMAVLGWRLNDAEVASFFFAGAGQSYAEKMYGGQNRGVIACAVWTEKLAPTYFIGESPCSFHVTTHGMPMFSSGTSINYRGDDQQQTVCSLNCDVNTGPNLGIGFGSKIDQPVSRQHFVPASTEPLVVALIYYNDRSGLRAMGISLADTEFFNPNPFPGSSGCTPPSGWQGKE